MAKYFIERGTHVIRDNRKNFPAELKAIQLGKGQATFYQHEGTVITKYRATKDSASKKPKIVNVLSTAHGASFGNTNRRDKDGNIIQKPTSIIAYNHNMGGVDRIDQQLDGFDVLRKSYKWYKKLFLRLVMQCALASHKLYKLKEGKEDFLYYLLDVCTQLIQHAPRFQGPIRPPLDNIARPTGRNHWPAKRESLPNWKKMSSRTKWCRVCYAKGKKMTGGSYIKSSWVCKGCPGEPGLCLPECFEQYHTKFDFIH